MIISLFQQSVLLAFDEPTIWGWQERFDPADAADKTPQLPQLLAQNQLTNVTTNPPPFSSPSMRETLVGGRIGYSLKGHDLDTQGEATMSDFSRISIDSSIMNCQPCIRGMRLTVRRVLEALATYPDRNELYSEFPELEDEDVRQALAYAAANLDDKVLELREAS